MTTPMAMMQKLSRAKDRGQLMQILNMIEMRNRENLEVMRTASEIRNIVYISKRRRNGVMPKTMKR